MFSSKIRKVFIPIIEQRDVNIIWSNFGHFEEIVKVMGTYEVPVIILFQILSMFLPSEFLVSINSLSKSNIMHGLVPERWYDTPTLRQSQSKNSKIATTFSFVTSHATESHFSRISARSLRDAILLSMNPF